MATKTQKTTDLREATEITDRVKQIASKVYGFHAYLVKPLEADGDDPSKYCMFEVNGIQYQVNDGALSIFEQDEE